MADIDMQRLDWRQAIRIYEQIRTLRPDDEATRKNLVDLSLRLGQTAQAAAELESYMSYLQTSNNRIRAIPFIEELLQDRPEDITLRRNLAQAYHQAGRVDDAVKELDAIAESMLDTGKKDDAVVIINQILLMNPPNADQYRQLLIQLQG
jgi:predicted Zn-dependent protease